MAVLYFLFKAPPGALSLVSPGASRACAAPQFKRGARAGAGEPATRRWHKRVQLSKSSTRTDDIYVLDDDIDRVEITNL